MTTGPERLTQFEQWRVDREIEAIARKLRAGERGITPFPDPEGEDRDERRVIEWDFTR